jgi:hypothetical protein
MGFLDFLTSTRRPAAGTPALSPEQVRERILALNRPSAPFQIMDGKSENAELIAEWKIVDAQWYEIFAKAGLSKVFKIYLTLVPEKQEVQALDKEYSVEWRAGVPKLSIAAKAFRGQTQSIEFGKAYGFTEELKPGVVYNYRFNTKEIKQPIQDAVTAAGWTYKGKVL